MKHLSFADKIVIRIFDADLTYSNVTNICYEARIYGYYGVQVFPNMLELCRQALSDSGIHLASVIAYPHGTFNAAQKAVEIRDAIGLGANQLEVCVNCLNVRSEQWDLVRDEMKACREAAGKNILKFILEVEYLTDEQIKMCAQIAVEEQIDCLITSTGLYNTVDENKVDHPIRCTTKDIRLMKDVVGDRVKIMAQGNIDSPAMAEELIAAGADYVGIEKTIPFLYPKEAI